MATPPNRSTANSDALANQALIVSAADQVFIDDATIAILDAIDLGKFEVYLTTSEPQNVQTLHDYFVSLGYMVGYPGLGMKPGSFISQFEPAQLFGQYWEMFWQHSFPPLKNPTRMVISWRS